MWPAFQPIEAKSSASLPEGDGWWYEPKWDGFRCLVFRDHGEINLQAKSGKSLTRFFPEVVAQVAHLPQRQFVLDCELLGGADPTTSFKMLQARLHPSVKHVNRLAVETPARLVAFDLLMNAAGDDLRNKPFAYRRKCLEAFLRGVEPCARLSMSPGVTSIVDARAWLEQRAIEGVVAKRQDQPYLAGERIMTKVKRARTADCVVGGFRYAANKPVVGSLLLGLYDEKGKLNHVGFTAGLKQHERIELTPRLEAMRGAGFDGDRPGRPKPVVHGTVGAVDSTKARHRSRGLIRPCVEWAVSAWNTPNTVSP